MKDKIVRYLLEVGKKYKLMTYPVLGIIAIITAFSCAIKWGKSSGKKYVASAMIVVLLVVQSLTFSSSAQVDKSNVRNVEQGSPTDADEEENESEETGELENPDTDDNEGDDTNDDEDDEDEDDAGEEDEEDTEEPSDDENGIVNYYLVTSDGNISIRNEAVVRKDEKNVWIKVPTDVEKAEWAFNDDTFTNYYNFSELFYDSAGATPVNGDMLAVEEDDEYDVYIIPTRKAYRFLITEDGESEDNIDTIDEIMPIYGEVTAGVLYPPIEYTVENASSYNAYKWGCDFVGLKYDGRIYDVGNMTIYPTSNEPIELYYAWAKTNIEINLDAVSDEDSAYINVEGDEIHKVTCLYGDNIVLPSELDMNSWAGKEGYYLAGWTDGESIFEPGETIDSSTICEKNMDISSNPNVVGKTLTAIWAYKEITLIVNGNNCDVSSDENSTVIGGIYGNNISFSVSAEYKTDYSEGNKFSYGMSQEDIFKLGKYGLKVTTESNGNKITSYTVSGKLTDICDGIDVVLQVNDENKPAGKRTSNHLIRLVVDKRPVVLDNTSVKNLSGEGAPSKIYDGNYLIAVKDTADVTAVIGGDKVYAKFNSSAKLDSVDVGNKKTVTLSNVVLAGDDSAKYTLEGYDSDGSSITINDYAEVFKRPITLKMDLKSGSTANVLFGQANPEYTISIADINGLAESDRNLYNKQASDEDKMQFVKNYIGFAGWETNRQIYSLPGEYEVRPIISDQGSNYVVSNGSIKGTFKVQRDKGEKNVNFKLSCEPGKNNYYPKLTIVPYGNYDRIRRVELGDSDINSSYSREQVSSMFVNEIAIPDMTNGTIAFQMYDSSTGAVTELCTMKNVSVDSTPPEYVRHSVTPGANFFKQYDFGTYYRNQVINGKDVECVTITLEYSSKESECDTLYYYFVDDAGNNIGDMTRAIALKKNAMGYYQASIVIGTGTSGQLVVYATDTTGNESVKKKIRMVKADNYDEDNEYYEWMVENAIVSSVINVIDKSGTAVNTDSIWHNNLFFEVDAEDADSGLNRLEWEVIRPDGKANTIIDNAGQNISNIKDMSSYGKIYSYSFNYELGNQENDAGTYTVGATLYDNAGNSVKLSQVGPYLFDSNPPSIDFVDPDNTNYRSGVNFEFSVTEPENESGVAAVSLYKETVGSDSLCGFWGTEDIYSYNVTENGNYIIVAVDVAGNTSEKMVTFQKISDVIPDDPVINVSLGDGKQGNDGWYIENYPKVSISSKSMTDDGIPVTTYYKVKTPTKEIEVTLDKENSEIDINESGEIVIDAWSESQSGCKSNIVSTTIKVDTKAPEVYFTESTVDDNNNLVINFRAIDEISGVNTDNINVNGKKIDVDEVDGVVSGSFIADGNDTYVISVSDFAGNASKNIEFVPLSLITKPVKNITTNSARLESIVYQGTYAISDCYIAYKKSDSKNYETCLSNKNNNVNSIEMSYDFNNLKPDTEYDYKVYAKTKISREVKIVEGSFRTKAIGANGNFHGTVIYGSDIDISLRSYPIYVSLYKGETMISCYEIGDTNDNYYKFEGLSDGNYRVVATNGILTKESSVIIEEGGIVYPESYSSNNGINFILDGLSTSVVIDDGELGITVDGLEKIYNTELYNGNVTSKDMEVVDNGGTIDICLHASYIDPENVSEEDNNLFVIKMGENVEILKYLQLYVVKTVRDKDGNTVNGTPINLTQLAEKLTISIPLYELAGENIYVANLHDSDWNSISDISINGDYITIKTDKFSLYALYRVKEIAKYYTVKWYDGDGELLKEETVKEGDAATPPEEIPTKAEDENYYYEFTKWDSDYANVSSDMNIVAWFKKYKKSENMPTTEDVTTETGTTEATSTEATAEDATTEISTTEKNTTQEVASSTSEEKILTTGKESKTESNTSSNGEYTYMGAKDSPATGDKADLLAIVAIMISSLGALVVVHDKRRKMNQ